MSRAQLGSRAAGSAGHVGRELDGVGLGEVGGTADGAPLAVFGGGLRRGAGCTRGGRRDGMARRLAIWTRISAARTGSPAGPAGFCRTRRLMAPTVSV